MAESNQPGRAGEREPGVDQNDLIPQPTGAQSVGQHGDPLGARRHQLFSSHVGQGDDL